MCDVCYFDVSGVVLCCCCHLICLFVRFHLMLSLNASFAVLLLFSFVALFLMLSVVVFVRQAVCAVGFLTVQKKGI